MNFPNKSIFDNRSLLQEYLGKVKEGYSLSENDKDDIMKAFYRIHDKLFDQELKFNQSEISQPPIQISYHQLNKILFFYFLHQLKTNQVARSEEIGNNFKNMDSNFNTNQSAKSVIDKFNALKYSHTILLYFWWLINDFFPNQIEKVALYLSKNIKKMPDFQAMLKKYGIQTGQLLSNGKKINSMSFHNLINLVLVYGKYLDENNSSEQKNDESKSALYFYRQFISAKNKITDLLAKFSVQALYPITDQSYSLWETSLYRNYYFRYVIYLSQFYDVGYNNLSQFFQKKQYFTYRLVKDHLLLTGFDPVNLEDREYIISDAIIQKTQQKLVIHNLIARADVTVGQTIKKIKNNQTSSLRQAYDQELYGTWVMSYDNTLRQFTVRIPTEKNGPLINSRSRISKNAPKMNPLDILKPPSESPLGTPDSSTTPEKDIQLIKIKISQETVGGKPKTVMEVYLNETFLYVFFKQDLFFHLLRRCDGKIIGSVTENINALDYFKKKEHQPNALLETQQEIAYAQTDMLFPFEYVIFNYCCQALVSKFSTRLDTIASKFFRQVKEVFQPKPGEINQPVVKKNTSSEAEPKCLFVYHKFPYLKQEYRKLMA